MCESPSRKFVYDEGIDGCVRVCMRDIFASTGDLTPYVLPNQPLFEENNTLFLGFCDEVWPFLGRHVALRAQEEPGGHKEGESKLVLVLREDINDHRQQACTSKYDATMHFGKVLD